MGAHPPLEPRRLLPALLRWGEAGAPAAARAQALRYIQFCIARLASTDAAVHNLAVSPAVLPWHSGCPAHMLRIFHCSVLYYFLHIAVSGSIYIACLGKVC